MQFLKMLQILKSFLENMGAGKLVLKSKQTHTHTHADAQKNVNTMARKALTPRPLSRGTFPSRR